MVSSPYGKHNALALQRRGGQVEKREIIKRGERKVCFVRRALKGRGEEGRKPGVFPQLRYQERRRRPLGRGAIKSELRNREEGRGGGT